MLLMPDPATATLDPFTAAPTLSLVCEIADPHTGEPYARDPRRVARRAEEHLRETGIADTANFGPECEFFVFDEVSYDARRRTGRTTPSTRAEGHWNSATPGLGYTVREKGGYFPPAPHDTLADLRSEIVLTLERLGIPCEFHHHEVASAGSARSTSATSRSRAWPTRSWPTSTSSATSPRPPARRRPSCRSRSSADNGSGMHTHQSLWKEGTPLFADKSGYAGLSKLARGYIGGHPHAHAGALLAFCAPTTNSYRRLVPGLRGAGQPRLLAAEPLGGDPDPDVLGARRRPSASSSDARTRPRTRTSPSRRC